MSASDGLIGLPLPGDFLRRSPIYPKLRVQEAVFGEVAGAAVPLRYREGGEETTAQTLGIADLSPLPRLGFKGRAVLSRLNTEGMRLEFRPNRAFEQKGGKLAAVLAMTEVLLLSPLSGDAPELEALSRDWSIENADGSYLVPRQDSHFWFLITGQEAASMFAKLCAVDLREKAFENHAIAQTSVAKTHAIIIREDRGNVPAYHLLGDSASAGYMWDCLMDAMAEWKGRPVGLSALQALT